MGNGRTRQLGELANLVTLLGGAAYGASTLWKAWLCPWLCGPVKSSPSSLDLVVGCLQTIQGDLAALAVAMDGLRERMDLQTERVQRQQELIQVMQLEDGCVKEIKSDIHSIKAILASSVCPPSFATKKLGDLEEDEGDSGAGESPAAESVGTGEAEEGTEAEDGNEADDETEAGGKTGGKESQDTDENGSWSGLEDQEELLKNYNGEINKDDKTDREAEEEIEEEGMEEEKEEEEVEVEARNDEERELSFVDGQWIEE